MISASSGAEIKTVVNKYGIWILIGAVFSIVVSRAITDMKFLYFGILLVPLCIYMAVEKPFIFPFGLYVFLLPFDSILSVSGSADGTTLTKLLGILSICVLTLKGFTENKVKIPDPAAMWWSLFVLYGIVSILWSIDPKLGINIIPTALGLLILYLAAVSYRISGSEYETLKKCIFMGGFLSSLLAIGAYLTSSSAERATIMMGDRAANPNSTAFDLLLPIAIAIGMMLRQKKMVIKCLHWAALTVMVFCLFVTGSRGGLLGLGAIVIAYIMGIKNKTSFGIVIAVVVIAVLSVTSDYFVQRIAGTLETGGEGRAAIWKVGLDALESYWVLGAGLNNFPLAYHEVANFGPSARSTFRAAHNTYLCFLVELGIFGTSLMVIGMIKHYKAIGARFRRHDLDSIMLKGTFLAALIVSFVGDKIWDKSFWLLLMMILMHRNSSGPIRHNAGGF